jgi:hypothetical protein
MIFWVKLAQHYRVWPILLYRGTKRYVQVTEYMYRNYTEIYSLTAQHRRPRLTHLGRRRRSHGMPRVTLVPTDGAVLNGARKLLACS